MKNKLICISLCLIILIYLGNCLKGDREFSHNIDEKIVKENISFEETLNEINQIVLNNKIHRSENIISQIGSNIAEEIAVCFVDRKPGTFSESTDFSKTENVAFINSIVPLAGYYIQQDARKFQGKNRAPEILILSVENENVYIREIDVENGEIVIRNRILLEFNGCIFQMKSSSCPAT